MNDLFGVTRTMNGGHNQTTIGVPSIDTAGLHIKQDRFFQHTAFYFVFKLSKIKSPPTGEINFRKIWLNW
jgi:hypothetical protein